MSLLPVIKQAAKDAVDATNPVIVLFGVVTSVNPLKVNVDQRFNLTADFLILTEATREWKVTLGGAEYVVREGLQVDDKVILLRMQGGHKYVVADKVVSQ
ncbi:DUF2577 domain-containing protein [Paenibacillus sp. HB172176]|uniref:DUF2577 domain-containing protein n=1 Tax=Paenibacillus sp. HB172176 TaxID=2493690 RepID=UPI001439E1F2|nr:DUF2577 domain-containing protein [Paenibacillus sp. HB172176]